MRWGTGIEQDRDGYWVVIDHENHFGAERVGPFDSQEDAKAAELRKRIELHVTLGPAERP